MALPLPERLTGAAHELSSVIDSTPRDAEVTLSRIHAACLVLLLKEAVASAEKTRASIDAFLTSEAQRIDANCEALLAIGDPSNEPAYLRLRTQASIGRTWAAQVARGDDLLPPGLSGERRRR